MTREPGYYWVKIIDEWDIARWTGTYWYFAGVDSVFFDRDFQEIDENKLVKK